MRPDLNDPNNHVPPVSDEDEWDDEDNGEKSMGASSQNLPPKRGGLGIDEIKLGNITPVDEAVSGKVTESENQIDAVLEDVPKNPQSEIPSKLHIRKKSVKPLAAPKDFLSGKGKAEKNVEKQADNAILDEHIVLPSPGTNPLRVKEIGSADTAAYPRPDPTKMSKKRSGERSKMAGGGRRWGNDAEGAGWGTKGGIGNFKWIVFSGLGAMALVIAAVLLSLSENEEQERRVKDSYFSKIEINDAETSKEEEAAELARLNSSRDQAIEIYGAYATANDPSALKGLLHDETEVLPLVVENWEPLNYPEGWSPDSSANWTALDLGGIRYGVLNGLNPDYNSFRAVYRIDSKGLTMDWKATVGYGTSSFEALVSGEGDGSEIRGRLSEAAFYTFSYPESGWVSYRFASPSKKETLWIYTAKDSDISKTFSEKFAVRQITGDKIGAVEVTLSIKAGNDESLPNQWEIGELLSMSWLEE